MSKADLLRTAAPTRFIREPELLARTGLSATAIDILEERGDFPRRVPLGARAIAWIESEVVAWQQRRIALRDDAATDAEARRKRRVVHEDTEPPD
jgi:prophage regulatory protein